MFNEMMRAEIWLQEHLESQKGIDELANRLGYSTSQVRRRFKQCFGITPSAYRDVLRLEKAARLLILTPDSISTIATHCGYRNHPSFSRAFQRLYGQSPRQFRRHHRARLAALCPEAAPPPFEIRQYATRKALVTRVYKPLQRVNDLTRLARKLHGSETLPNRLNRAPGMAVMHNLLQPCRLERIDLGLMIPPNAGTGLAIPPTFRLLELPPRQHACVVVEAFSDIPTAVHQLVTYCLPQNRRYANGEPVQVHWHPRGLEVQLPLLAKASPRK
ncbi:AraC family transcriptional regulator [Halomonas sp. NO4]|uniref:helix-turn-helix transcriptional regulator n=1 Tax=Halomonas sp. NO4 TaxID=2484813 RepID=UPI0013D36824|nr:AraC family transcriptional regulator [Halomonas sp. NO4]